VTAALSHCAAWPQSHPPRLGPFLLTRGLAHALAPRATGTSRTRTGAPLKSAVGPGRSVIGLSGRRALLPWGLRWLNCRSLLSTRERLLSNFDFGAQRCDVVGQPLHLSPIG
jgi:hypothetical protein